MGLPHIPLPDTGASVEAERANPELDQLDDGYVWGRFGVPVSPEQSVDLADGLQHTVDSHDGPTGDKRAATFWMLTEGPIAEAEHRRQTLEHWRRRAAELEAEEQALHVSMSPSIARVYSGKRLLLSQEMLSELD